MRTIKARNVNQALGKGIHLLQLEGELEESRNGDVLVAPTPVVTVYDKPRERVLFCPIRDANPFFHLLECLWMMAGSNDLAWPLFFNSRFSGFSDDGSTLHGAYGHRWRFAFHIDQLKKIIMELNDNPGSRRVVLQMWSAGTDLGRNGKDLPCNTHIYFLKRGDALDMTVCNRSNDIVWGAYGANAVHMSFLQEVIAHCVGLKVGKYYQFSNNYHVYIDVVPPDQFASRIISAIDHDVYSNGHVKHFPVIQTSLQDWDADVKKFLADPTERTNYNDPFFNSVAYPMFMSFSERKNKTGDGLQWAKLIQAQDWRMACVAWIERRSK